MKELEEIVNILQKLSSRNLNSSIYEKKILELTSIIKEKIGNSDYNKSEVSSKLSSFEESINRLSSDQIKKSKIFDNFKKYLEKK